MPRSSEDLTRAVARYIDRHRLLPAGPVIVAFSGGPDSLLLLHLLADLAPARGWRLTAAHLDHGLRPESAAEVEQARALAAARGVPLAAAREDIGAQARAHGWGVEEAGRIARYRFLAALARQAGGAPVATGHTRNDQAETLLLRLQRGTGPAGLRAMRPATELWPEVWRGDRSAPPLRVVRPLLGISRAEIERELERRDLTPLRDPSNAAPVYARNRVRRELLPLWEEIAPGVTERLARAADIVAADEEFLAAETERRWVRLARFRSFDSQVAFDRAAFLAQPPALQRRLLRRAVGRFTPEEPTLAAIELALAEAAKREGGAADLARSVRLVAAGSKILIGPGAAIESEPAKLAIPWMVAGQPMALTVEAEFAEPDGAVEREAEITTILPGGWWAMTCRRVAADACVAPLSGRHAHFRLALEEAAPVVRAWRHGDRIALPGLGGHKKLSDLFIDRKIARAARAGIPLVVAGDGSIAWVAGLAVGEPWRAMGDEKFVLCCTIEPTSDA